MLISVPLPRDTNEGAYGIARGTVSPFTVFSDVDAGAAVLTLDGWHGRDFGLLRIA